MNLDPSFFFSTLFLVKESKKMEILNLWMVPETPNPPIFGHPVVYIYEFEKKDK